MKLIDKKEFGKVVLYKEFKTFVVHIAALETLLAKITIYFSQRAQIAALKQDEALI